jgi:flagellar protein FliS
MAFDVNNPYFRTKVMTASQEELRLLLLEGCLRFLREGRDGLASKDYEKSYSGFSQGKAIIIELLNALKPEVAPELCKNLSALYTYMYTTLTEAVHAKDFVRIDEVINLVEFERETWVMLMEKIAAEKAGASPTPPAAAAATPPKGFTSATEAAMRPALSIRG